MSNSITNIALDRWRLPNPHFSHGQDSRSSDRGLLFGLYGGLVRAANHDWQNAGRVLVDRTDIRILFDSYQLPLPVRPLDQGCRALDLFVRESIFPLWQSTRDRSDGFPGLIFCGDDWSGDNLSENDSAIISDWVSFVAEEVFGDVEYHYHAEVLLFFLCPGLFVLPGSGEKSGGLQGKAAMNGAIKNGAIKDLRKDDEDVSLLDKQLEGLGGWHKDMASRILSHSSW